MLFPATRADNLYLSVCITLISFVVDDYCLLIDICVNID